MFSRIERIVKEKEKYVVLRVKYLREDDDKIIEGLFVFDKKLSYLTKMM